MQGLEVYIIATIVSVCTPLETNMFKRLEGLRLSAGSVVSWSGLSSGPIHCCLLCEEREDCHSVNFNQNNGACETNNFGPHDSMAVTEVIQDWCIYYKSNAEDRELMLRATSGIGVSVRDTWLGTISPTPIQDTCISMATGVCSTHYRNSRIDVWSALSISEVTIEIYKGGSRVAFVTFNGTHSDRESWMSPSRVLSSSWKSLTSDRQYLIFSLEGEAPCARVFFILNNLGGCPLDAGWLVVLDPISSGCCYASWDDVINKPRFLYSTLDDLATFQSSDVDFADVMAIFIKKNS